MTAISPVIERGYLGQVLNLNRDNRELPMIYRRLFRLAPVEEPRFLVGREAEMEALSGARRLWEAGLPGFHRADRRKGKRENQPAELCGDGRIRRRPG